jgi:prepilin-type N-terminal cleavage/methylation domain-containing protein
MPRTSRTRLARARAAFTLLEVLVALTIIAVLLSVMLPALGHARTVSARTMCAANLRQLGHAWQTYLQDTNRFPISKGSLDWAWGGAEFVGPDRRPILAAERPLNRFVGAGAQESSADPGRVSAFRCPTDGGIFHSRERRAEGSILNGRSCFETYGTSYQANGSLAGASPNEAVAPSRLLLLGDPIWSLASRPSAPGTVPLDASWHGRAGAGNFLALDGAIRFVTFSPEPAPEFTTQLRDAR